MKKFLSFLSIVFLSMAIGACSSTPVKESTGEYLDNTVITTKVKAALLDAKDINSTQISVSSFKGVVQLSGFVNSAAQVQKAGVVASKVEGVTKVTNDLIVRSTT